MLETVRIVSQGKKYTSKPNGGYENFQMPFLKTDLEKIPLTYSMSFNTIEAEKFPNIP